jgi:hypothetical protein
METVLARLRNARTVELSGARAGREGQAGASDAETGWHVVLSDLVHLANSMEILVELARKGFARHLRGQPQLQAEAVTYLDSHILDKVHHGTILFDYVRQNFGELAPLRLKRRLMFEWFFELLLPVLNVFFLVQPGLATLLILCYEKVGVYYYEVLARAARHQGRPALATIADSIRRDQARHALGMATLLELAPIDGWFSRLVARILITLWYGDVMTSLEGPIDPEARRSNRAIGFDAPWYVTRVEHVRHQMAARYAMPWRVCAEVREELERIAFAS